MCILSSVSLHVSVAFFFFNIHYQDIPEFIHSPIEGHLGHSQTLAITNKTSLSICVDLGGKGFQFPRLNVKEYGCLYGKSAFSAVRNIHPGFQRIGTTQEQCRSKWCHVFNFQFCLFIFIMLKTTVFCLLALYSITHLHVFDSLPSFSFAASSKSVCW